MNHLRNLHPRLLSRAAHLHSTLLQARFFSGTIPYLACHSNQKMQTKSGSGSCQQNEPSKSASAETPSQNTKSMLSAAFWSCHSTWRRSGLNTSRCLVGCTVGDFSALWTLQSYCPELGMNTIMLAAMASGITTSVILETVLLKLGPDNLSWNKAGQTAMGMGMVSMVAMELAENAVDYHLTGGVIAFENPQFWAAAMLSIGAGFLAPLPYNYARLKRYGKACH